MALTNRFSCTAHAFRAVAMYRFRTSSAQRGWVRASQFGPGSNDRREVANSDPEANRRSGPSIWTLTLGLIAFFLLISFVAVLLATHFEWLNQRTLPFDLVTMAHPESRPETHRHSRHGPDAHAGSAT